ncbi:M48 family metalloprotease [Candidatus Micrarchaeota archaeon]|nr:M48 family metalloprotease [Candidatus Micrarchaeota archaeon]
MRFYLSQIVSLGFLFALLLIPINIVFWLFGMPAIYSVAAAILTIIVCWWFGSRIYDYIFTKKYGAKWISIEQLTQSHDSLGMFIKDLLHKEGLQIRKIGIVDEDRPICITYGASKNDIHLLITQGIFNYLTEEEQQAIFAHEIGHMKYGDFATLSAAYFPAFGFYELSKHYWRKISMQKSFLRPFGYLAYFFYTVYNTPILLQSRLREFVADKYACTKVNPNVLGAALCKISLAYISSSNKKRSVNFMETTRPFSIVDHMMARNLALAYMNRKETGIWVLTENLVMRSINNPWPAFYEFWSTHPLAGRRLMSICLDAKKQNFTPFLEMDRMLAQSVPTSILILHFLEDFAVFVIARLSPLIVLGLLLSGYFFDHAATVGVMVILYGLGNALISFYSFSYTRFIEGTVKSQLEDKFASPIRGRPLILDGVIREKSSVGLDLPEDLVFADYSGELFIGPRSLVPLMVSPFISASKLMGLKDQRIKVRGWYMHDRYPKLIIDEIKTKTQTVRGRQRLFDVGTACLFISIGILFLLH